MCIIILVLINTTVMIRLKDTLHNDHGSSLVNVRHHAQ